MINEVMILKNIGSYEYLNSSTYEEISNKKLHVLYYKSENKTINDINQKFIAEINSNGNSVNFVFVLINDFVKALSGIYNYNKIPSHLIDNTIINAYCDMLSENNQAGNIKIVDTSCVDELLYSKAYYRTSYSVFQPYKEFTKNYLHTPLKMTGYDYITYMFPINPYDRKVHDIFVSLQDGVYLAARELKDDEESLAIFEKLVRYIKID